MLIKAQNKMTPATTLKNKKMAKFSHFPLGGTDANTCVISRYNQSIVLLTPFLLNQCIEN